MHAAVVTSFDHPPTYQDYPVPAPQSADEVLVDVLAAGLHPRVRSQADGSHYSSADELPLVPGIDGVGRAPDGTLRYFVLPDTTMGAMAEQTVVDLRRTVALPPDADPVQVAAAMNPAMSSWVALRRRIDFPPGQRVLVLGATGNAGRLAIQVARRLGAVHVVAAGRDESRLVGLTTVGADVTVALRGEPDEVAGRLGDAARDVDVVLDYLWGEPTVVALVAVLTHRTDRSRPLTWIEVGSVAGPAAAIPSAALRAARLQIVGSGQGSVATQDFVTELGDLVAEIAQGNLSIEVRTVPLADVATAWTDPAGDARVVITP